MKKLLIMMAVLVMASVASAGYNPGWYITVDTVGATLQGTTFSVSVDVGSSVAMTQFSGSDSALAKMTVTGGTVSNVVINASAGWAVNGGISEDSGVISIAATAGSTAIPVNTTLFTFDITAPGENGTIIIDASSGLWNTWTAVAGDLDGFHTGANAIEANEAGTAGYAVINVTPEPMTMALLGLGGLFLRRRRA